VLGPPQGKLIGDATSRGQMAKVAVAIYAPACPAVSELLARLADSVGLGVYTVCYEHV